MKVRRAIITLILGISVFSNAQAAQIVIDSAASYGEATMVAVAPQEQFQAIDDNFDELYGFWATIDTEAEFKALYNLEDDVDFYTTSTLDTMLLDYVTSSALTTTLGDYVLTSALTTALSDYVLSSALTTTLADYVLTSALATATVQTAGELSPTKESGVAGYLDLFEADTTNTLTSGFQGPDDLSVNIRYKLPDTVGTSGQVLAFGTPLTGQTFKDGVTGTLIPLVNSDMTGGDVTASSETTFTNKTIDANGTGNNISNIEPGDIAPSALIISTEIGGMLTDNQFITAKAAKDYADSLAISGSVPTVQASDPTIASSTGYYIATNDYHYFWNEYGIRTVDLTAGALDDSDTSAPVGVADADSTHSGTEDSITSGIDWTENYLDASTITCTVVNATPTNPTITTVGNASDTEALTPDGTGTVTCTWAADDLAGNSATGTDLVQEFTYSGGASYLTDWGMTTTSLTTPSGATATLNGATVDTNGLYVEGTDYPSIPFVDGVGVVGTASTIEFSYTQVGTPHSSGRFFEDDTNGSELNLQRGGSNTAINLVVSGLTDTTSFSSLTINVFDGLEHTIKFEWDVYGTIDGSYFAKLTLDGTEVHYSSSDWPNGIDLSDGNLYIGNRGTGDRPLNGTFKNFKCY